MGPGHVALALGVPAALQAQALPQARQAVARAEVDRQRGAHGREGVHAVLGAPVGQQQAGARTPAWGCAAPARSRASSAPGSRRRSALAGATHGCCVRRATRLTAGPYPRLSPSARSRAHGCSSRTSWAEPSLDALSTTHTSARPASWSACRERRHASRRSRRFQETTATATHGPLGVTGRPARGTAPRARPRCGAGRRPARARDSAPASRGRRPGRGPRAARAPGRPPRRARTGARRPRRPGPRGSPSFVPTPGVPQASPSATTRPKASAREGSTLTQAAR